MIRATTKSRAGVIFIASMLLAFQMGEKINLGEHPKPATHDHLKTGHP